MFWILVGVACDNEDDDKDDNEADNQEESNGDVNDFAK